MRGDAGRRTGEAMIQSMPAPPSRNARRISGEQVLCVLVTFLVGLHLETFGDIRVGAVAAVATLPIWIRVMPRYRGPVLLLVLALLASLTGWVCSLVFSTSHDVLPSAMLSRSGLILGLALSAAMLVWARDQLGAKGMALSFAFGLVASIWVLPQSPADNPWRFVYSIPITVFVLALAWIVDRWWIEVVCLLALAVIGVQNDSRSNSAILFLAAVVIAWQAISRSLFGRRRRASVAIAGLALTGLACFLIAQAAIVEGVFGEVTQQRTIEQIERGGNVLLGGRPEIAASIALVTRYPFGLGSGTRATLEDVLAAKTSMEAIGYSPDNNYVNRFMFGSGVEVHSVIGDAWVWMGVVGAALIVAITIVILRGFTAGVRTSSLAGLFVYLAVRFVWDLAFSPLPSASVLMALTIAIAVLPRLGVAGSHSVVASGSAEVGQHERSRPRVDQVRTRRAP
jgi:hypothetical protein